MDNPSAAPVPTGPLKTGFSYFGVRRPEHVRRDMAEMRAEGNTHVLHTWSEDDLAYYADTMGRIIEISREEGLEVYVNPWGVGRVFGGEALSELVAKNPGSCQVDSLGHPVAAICPNHPAFVDYMDNWVDAVCSTAVETIFWDEPHFHFRKSDLGVWSCRCQACLAGYRERFGEDMPAQQDDSVRTFREEGLRRFLARMFGRVSSHGKRNCVCLLPDTFPAGIHDWSTIASLPGLHELSTDPYWEAGATAAEVEATYRRYSLRTVELARAHGLEAQMWIKNYRIARGEEELCRIATRVAFETGIRNLFAWSWRASEWLSWLRSEDPRQVHASQLEAFAKCR